MSSNVTKSFDDKLSKFQVITFLEDDGDDAVDQKDVSSLFCFKNFYRTYFDIEYKEFFSDQNARENNTSLFQFRVQSFIATNLLKIIEKN